MSAYKLKLWKDPGRKRRNNIRFTDEEFVKYYDLDLEDFTGLVMKLQNSIRLSYNEELRYTDYLYTICNIVFENQKFKRKSVTEKEELQEQAIFELLDILPKHFDGTKGSLYSYAYRCCYVAYCHYYTNKIQDHKRKKMIEEHCMNELNEYLSEIGTGKVNNFNIGGN